MTRHISIEDAERPLAEFVNGLQKGDSLVVLREGKAVAELQPVATPPALGDLPAILRGLPHLGPQEAEAFASDLAAIRASLSMPANPWER